MFLLISIEAGENSSRKVTFKTAFNEKAVRLYYWLVAIDEDP